MTDSDFLEIRDFLESTAKNDFKVDYQEYEVGGFIVSKWFLRFGESHGKRKTLVFESLKELLVWYKGFQEGCNYVTNLKNALGD